MAIMFPTASSFSPAANRQGWLPLLAAAGLALCSVAHAAAPDSQGDFACTFDDNVTHVRDGGTRMSDRSCSLSLSHPYIFPLAEHWRTVMTGTLGGEVYASSRGLNNLTEGIRGELQYRSSAEFGTPTFVLYAKVSASQYQSWMRDGYRYGAGLYAFQDLTDRLRLFGDAAHNERRSNSTVFDSGEDALHINLDFKPRLEDTIYLGGEYRHGDLVISAPESWSTNNRNAYVPDDAFPGANVYSFRFTGTTTLTSLGYNMKLSPRSALDLSWRQARSSVTYVTPSMANASVSYIDNQYSLAYLLHF